MSKTQKAIRILVYTNLVVWLTLALFIQANSMTASGQTIPQPDSEYIQVSQVWLPIVCGGGE